MAKKKRKKEEEKVIFKRPEFDEKEFMRKEILNAKVGVITFFYAIPFAVVSWQLAIAGLSIFGLLAAIIGILSLRYIYPLFKVEVESFERKSWLGHGAVFAFTWLSIWVLLLNPPFSDLASPDIGKVQVNGDNTTWGNVSKGDTITVDLAEPVGNLGVKARITDNVGISRVEIETVGTTVQGVPVGGEPHVYAATIPVGMPHIPATATIRAWDAAGHMTTYTFTLAFT